MRKIFLLIFAVLFSTSAVAQSGRRVKTPPPAPVQPSVQTPTVSDEADDDVPATPLASSVMPESLLTRQIISLDKGSFRLADFTGKVVVLNLWATWCGPCRMEVPEYEKVRKQYAGKAVEFIALTTEDPRTASDRVKQFAREFNFGFRLGWADREMALTIMNGRNVIPQTLVLSPDGRIISHWRGYARGRNGDQLRAAIERALSEFRP
ncbi:MAG: TlpA family protein disulfide reductase [Pyrinomonadaceae bacterium]|nr:TlpA family protein disulfide reductase [Pyrinomonadaceae bacterium]